MEIKYLGHSSFLIKTKTAKVVTDPYDPEVVGMRFPKTEADIITISHHHHDHDNASVVAKPQTGEQLMIDLPGEFERLGVRIFGYLSYHDKTKGSERGEDILYKIEAEGVTLLHCGDLGYVPEDSFLDSLGDIDMAKGIEHKTMLKIGFLNKDIEENKDIYEKNFDVVILNDGPMDFVVSLIKNI